MTIFAKNIKIKEWLSVSVLSNRDTARSLVKEVKNTNKSKIKLDFSDIEFASRSFMDELNSLIQDDKERAYSKTNMIDQVSKMDHLVQKRGENNSQTSTYNRHEDADLVAM